MPDSPTYPGVYIEEIPSGVRTIVGVSTSVTAFVGYFERGPLDTPLQIRSMGEFNREFRGLHRDDEAGYAVQQFFLNGGSEAWVVRVTSNSPSAPEASAVTMQDTGGTAALTASAGRDFRGRSVDDPGTWGDAIRIEVDYDTADPNGTDLHNVRVSEVVSRSGQRVALRTETFANLSVTSSNPTYGVAKVNEGSKMVQLTEEAAARPAQTGTTGIAVNPTQDFDATASLNVDAGTGNRTITLSELSGPTTFGSSPGVVRRALERALQADGQSSGISALAGAAVTVQGDHLRVVAGGGSAASFDPELIIVFSNNGADATATELGLADATNNVQEYVLGTTTNAGLQQDGCAGVDGGLPDADALIGDFGRKTGFHALREVDIFNLLCIPGAVAPGANPKTVYAAAQTFCEDERVFLIVDIPETIDEVQEAKDWVDDANIRHRNLAVYFPRVRIPDPLNEGRLRSVGASGTLAGIYARTDAERGVWNAPAGQDAVLRNVQGLATKLTDPESGQLNSAGINALRRFPVYGRVAWGSRTLAGADALASEWKYVPVRRMALFLEESLSRGLQWVVFEPNDEPLWSQIRLNVEAFMCGLFRGGAFHGTSPRDAYFVKCDAETTTQDDINAGIVNIIVGFAPLKPAEFVIVKIQQIVRNIQS